MRIGIGYDIHRLVTGRRLVLGGVSIPFAKGLKGHSDGDVVLHAVADAVLGAAGGPDIGTLFPDTEEKNRDMDSARIVRRAVREAGKRGLQPANADLVVICEEPKLAAWYGDIRRRIAELLGIGQSQVGIKAKTSERLGDTGKGRAVACLAAVCLDRKRRSR